MCSRGAKRDFGNTGVELHQLAPYSITSYSNDVGGGDGDEKERKRDLPLGKLLLLGRVQLGCTW